jgi:hypothetical protein
MARTAVTTLRQQIEEVRREGFAAGYAAAMQAIREVASGSAPEAGSTTPRRRRRARQAAPAAQPVRRRARATNDIATTRRSAARRPQRGTNARLIGEILQASAPHAMRPAEIRKALQDKGVAMAFASIGHALGQLEARNAAEQVGDSKTWRHRNAAS